MRSSRRGAPAIAMLAAVTGLMISAPGTALAAGGGSHPGNGMAPGQAKIRAAARADPMVALWHMNETSGTTMGDSSGNGNDGTLHSVTLGVAGCSATAYRFTGKPSYVSVPDSPTLDPGLASINISFCLNTTSLPTSGDYDLVRKGAYPNQQYKIELLQSGKIQCTFRGSANHDNATGGSGLTDGSWHHIACIKTSSQVQLVIDGAVAKTTNGTVGSISNADDVEIGAHPGSDWYKGRLDEVSMSFG